MPPTFPPPACSPGSSCRTSPKLSKGAGRKHPAFGSPRSAYRSLRGSFPPRRSRRRCARPLRNWAISPPSATSTTFNASPGMEASTRGRSTSPSPGGGGPFPPGVVQVNPDDRVPAALQDLLLARETQNFQVVGVAAVVPVAKGSPGKLIQDDRYLLR